MNISEIMLKIKEFIDTPRNPSKNFSTNWIGLMDPATIVDCGNYIELNW